jgi:hypothetical protein
MRTKPSLLRAALLGLCLLLAVPEMALSASKSAQAAPAPSGRVNLEFGQGGFILSTSGGKGVLTYRGRRYPFAVGSVGFGGIGVSKVTAVGEVYDLNRLEDFAGAYGQARAGYAMGSGKGVQWLQNGNGVVIKLRTVTKGVSLDLGADGLVIKLK